MKLKARADNILQAYLNSFATSPCNQPRPYIPPQQPWPLPFLPFNVPSAGPHDPNYIVGPAGFGDQNYVTLGEALPYQINFENEPTAGLPAQVVTITQQLDPYLNWQSFRLGSFGFGGNTYEVPANQAFYQTQIDLTATDGFYVDVAATIDVQTGVAIWTFTTIDPATGQIPQDPSVGFLPPDSSPGVGEGFVSYTVSPLATDQTGDVINAQATVLFYTQPPLNTGTVSNTIDAGTGLTSTVAALPAYQNSSQFNVSWSGSDNNAGSAISGYTIYVSDNGGPYTVWPIDTNLTSATYTGQDGHTYRFYSIATDNAGNEQAPPATAQASTTVDTTPPTVTLSDPSATITAGGPVTYTVTYADANFNSDTLQPSDVTLNTTGNATATVGVSFVNSTTELVTLSNITGNGTLGISLDANTATDLAGNEAPAAGPSTTFTVQNGPAISGVVVAKAVPQSGALESNEQLITTWAVTDANPLTSESLTIDGNAVGAAYYGPFAASQTNVNYWAPYSGRSAPACTTTRSK